MLDFQLAKLSSRGEDLLQQVKDIFQEYQDLGLEELNLYNLPANMQGDNGPVKLVFVGQYSSGKSSIIKMLSGIETEIGAGIKTQEAHSYKWGDLEIIDTPGIHTELRPDHDEKTYYQINHAALLIFVVTNEGFDDRMGHHFRKLAIEQNRAKNMVLVVNKMDRTTMGNVPEQQEVIANDMLKVIEPYKSSDLYLSFLDTESYFMWQDEDDDEMRDIYYQQSGYREFVNNLNDFVKSRGVLSRIQAPLETLKAAITNIIGEADNFIDDADIDALEEVMRRKKNRIIEGTQRIHEEIREIAISCADKIKAEGESVASYIAPGVTEESAKHRIEAAQNQAELYIKQYENNMFDSLSQICEDLNVEIDMLENSKFSIDVVNNIEFKTANAGADDIVARASHSYDRVAASLEKIGMGAKGATKISVELPVLGNLKAASVVKDVGHFFGMRFKPWGAVNYVKNVANVLGYIGIAITAYQIISKVFGDDKEKEMMDNICKAQNQIRQSFNKAAEEVRSDMIEAATNKMDSLAAPVIQGVEEQLKEFESKKSRLKELNKSLQTVLLNVNNLMNEVQQTAKN